jgi:hypothetical protein
MKPSSRGARFASRGSPIASTQETSGGDAVGRGFRQSLSYLFERVDRAQSRFLMTALIVCLGLAEVVYVSTAVGGFQRTGRVSGSPSYGTIAANLVHHGRYSLDGIHFTAYRPPLYPLFLAGVMRFFPAAWLVAATILQGVLAVVVGAMLLVLARRLFENRLAMILVAALYASDIVLQYEMVCEVEIALFLVMVVGVFLLLSRDRDSTLQLASISVLVGLAHLTRPNGLVLLPILLGLSLASIRRDGARAFARAIPALWIPCLLVVLPWQWTLHRQLRLTTAYSSTVSGLILYLGNNPDFFTFFPYIWQDNYAPWIDRRLARAGMGDADELAQDRMMKTFAVDYIRSNPGAFTRGMGLKLAALYSPWPTPLGRGDLVDDNGRVVLKNFRTSSTLSRKLKTLHWSLILFGLTLFVTLGRRAVRPSRQRVLLAAGVFIVFLTLLHMVTVAATRYRLPMEPLAILLAAGGFAALALRLHPGFAPGPRLKEELP